MSSTVNIYVVVYMKPEFITIQNTYLKKHCIDKFKHIIINNGKDDAIKNEISKTCQDNGIDCIEYDRPPNIPHLCSHSHSVALEYALNNFIKKDNKDDITVVIDSDVFPFKQFSFYDILNSKMIAGMYQQRTLNPGLTPKQEFIYLSAIFTMFKNSIDLSEFSFQKGYGDTGSGTSELITKYPTEFIKHTAAIDIESDYIFKNNKNMQYPYKKEYKCQFLCNCFIHYYRGSNWAESDPKYHSSKLAFVKTFLENPVKYHLNLDEYISYSTAHSDKGFNGIDHNYKDYNFYRIFKSTK